MNAPALLIFFVLMISNCSALSDDLKEIFKSVVARKKDVGRKHQTKPEPSPYEYSFGSGYSGNSGLNGRSSGRKHQTKPEPSPYEYSFGSGFSGNSGLNGRNKYDSVYDAYNGFSRGGGFR